MDSWEKHQQSAIISKFWRMSAEIPSFACHPGHLMIEGTSDVGSGCSFSCRSFPTSKKHHSGIIEYAPKYGHEYNMYIHNVCVYIYIYIIIHIKYNIIYDTSYSLYYIHISIYLSMKYHSKYWWPIPPRLSPSKTLCGQNCQALRDPVKSASTRRRRESSGGMVVLKCSGDPGVRSHDNWNYWQLGYVWNCYDSLCLGLTIDNYW